MLLDKEFLLELYSSFFPSDFTYNFSNNSKMFYANLFSLFFSALLAGTLRTYQKAGCDAEYMSLSCPRGTQISIELAQYGNSLKGTLNFSTKHHLTNSKTTPFLCKRISPLQFGAPSLFNPNHFRFFLNFIAFTSIHWIPFVRTPKRSNIFSCQSQQYRAFYINKLFE